MSDTKTKTEIHVQERKQDRFWTVSIDPYYEPRNEKRGHRGRVDAHSQIDFGGDRWESAQVSWYSIGSVSVEEAEAFQKAVAIAIDSAKKMDLEHGISGS